MKFKLLKRILAVVLAVNIMLGTIPGLWNNVSAAPSVNLSVVSYEEGTLSLTWDLMPSRGNTVITYHSPDSASADKLVSPITIPNDDPNPNTKTIEGLRNDYVYDIKVEVYDSTNTTVIGEDILYFLPGISLYSEAVDQQPLEISGGGKESGVIPALKVSWVIPKVFNGTDYVDINDAPEQVSAALEKVDFLIRIEDSEERSNVLVSYDSITNAYRVNTSSDNNPDESAQVNYDSSTGRRFFYLLGRKDGSAHLPTRSEIDNNQYENSMDGDEVLPSVLVDPYNAENDQREFVLPHDGIFPGTVYNMWILAEPKNSGGGYVDVIYLGNSESSLKGKFPYVYTPIRFALTKDSMDYLYVKIYKVNDGSLDLPRLYYEVQTNSVPSNQDNTWTLKKTLDDTYFSGEFAYTVISGINPNNTVYYRIVVKTDGSEDRIESLKVPYALKDDISRPPVPKGVTYVKRELAVDPGHEEKSTNITIAWDKPANWDLIKAGEGNIYFNILLSIAPKDLNIEPDPVLEADGKTYGSFPVKYRLVKAVSAMSPNIDESGSKLLYTLNGFELFTWEDADGNTHSLPNSEDYPDFLLPNKVYYLQMYSSSGAYGIPADPSMMSDKSLITSFTTLSATQREVPLPGNFKLIGNKINNNKENLVELQFDKVNIDWKNYTSNHSAADAVYYDLYMNTRPDGAFLLIGSTQNTDGDVAFEGAKDSQNTYIRAKISFFTDGDLINRFGDKLLPNTTYYFYVRTRLVIENSSDESSQMESQPTAILPVTTPKGDVGEPDQSAKKPLAPVDFAIAEDADGNLMLSGQTVAFDWLKQENNVTYRLICTSEKVAPDAAPSTYMYDPLYQSFNEAFTGNSDQELTLDTAQVPLEENFKYDAKTKVCSYTINKWLFPNKLYYFSLRAESVAIEDGVEVVRTSAWVSIPVTTSLIESPAMLEPVNDSQLAFYWIDNSPGMKAEDYRVYVKGPEDRNYRLLNRSQSTVTKDARNGNIFYYGRIFNLKSDTQYSVKVEKPSISNGTTTYVKVYENLYMHTKDDCHEIEIRWKGLPVDDFSYYEISIKTSDDTDYTTLTTEDLEQYEDEISQKTYPYYMEKTAHTAGTNYSMYHARIKSVLVAMPDGTMQRKPLRSNMRYYIKVRAEKVDPSDHTLITYSKYIGPIDTRTEFNQDDYDDNDQDTKKKATFLDRIAKLEQKLFWRMGMKSSTTTKILLKGDRVANAIENDYGYSFTLDISDLEPGIGIDVVYMPVRILETLNSLNKSFVLKTPEAEFALRPGTINPANLEEAVRAKNKAGVKELFLKISVSRGNYPASGLPAGTKSISLVNDFKVQIAGSSKTDAQLKQMFHDRLYNNETGLVKEKLNILINPYDNDDTLTQQQLDQYIDMLVEDVEIELSEYVEDTVEGGNYTAGMILSKEDITAFDAPMQVKLMHKDSQGMKLPYVYYSGSNSWQKITGDIVYSNNALKFNAYETGKYTVLAVSAASDTVPYGHWGKESITRFASKYSLNDVFSGIDKSFNPDLSVSVKEIILLYEKVLGKTGENSGLDVKQKAKKLGLDKVMGTGSIHRDVSRQETAAVLIKLYCAKIGADSDSLVPRKNIYIKDEQKIDSKYYNHVVLAIDNGILTMDEDSNFVPDASMSRAQMITAFVRLLELAGDM